MLAAGGVANLGDASGVVGPLLGCPAERALDEEPECWGAREDEPECWGGRVGTGGGREGCDGTCCRDVLDDSETLSDEVERANQLLRLDALPPAASPLMPLTPLITLMASDLSFAPCDACPAALLIRFSFLASSFGSTGMGGRSCATNDFLDSAYEPRLPFPSRLGRCVLERALMREFGSLGPESFRDDLSYIEVAPGLRLPLASAARSP